MSDTRCSQENAVTRAVRSGVWNQLLEAHVSECVTCSGVREAAQWMQALAENDDASAQAERGLPDARIVWLRAQVEARHAAAERAQWVDVTCAMVVCITAAIWAAWNWGAVGGAITEALDWLALEAWPAFWSEFYAYGPANAPVLFSLALTVVAGVMVGVAYPLLLQE